MRERVGPPRRRAPAAAWVEAKGEPISGQLDDHLRSYGDLHRPGDRVDQIPVAPEERAGGSLAHRYDIPEVRLKPARPLLWVVLIDVAAVGIFRHVEFFRLYRSDQLLVCFWAAIFMMTVLQWFLSWRERPVMFPAAGKRS